MDLRAVYLNGKKQPFTPNTWVWLPPWTEHGIDNTGNETMEILCVKNPLSLCSPAAIQCVLLVLGL